MRLSRFSKKVIAIACSLAMVVAGLAFVPATNAKADAPDWSTIDYLGDGAGGGQYSNKYKYYCENGNVVNIQKPGWADEAGIYATFPAAGIQMDIDGYAVDGAGAVLYLSNFTKKVTEINITYAGGSTKAYVYYEDGEEGPTTTQDPSAPTTTAEPTTVNEWKTIDGDAPNQWYYNNVTKKNISNVVNIQKAPWAEEKGVYITTPAGISEVNVNGNTEGVAAIDGAGFIVYLSALTKKINEVTVTQGLGTSYIQIKNENGSEDPTEEPSVEPSTEAPTETEAPSESESETVTEAPSESESETVTEAPSESESETETEAPQPSTISTDDAQYHWLARESSGRFAYSTVDGPQYNTEGICAVYAGNWGGQHATMVVDQTSQDPYSVNADVTSTNDGAWLTQVAYKKTGLDATKTYKITLKANDIVLSERVVAEATSDQFCADAGTKLPTGQYTFTLDVEEQTKPEPPVVQDIVITPNAEQITANHMIYASWANPATTVKTYAYINEIDPGKGPIAANGWDFNVQAGQPMVGVDTVNKTKDNTIQITEGETYKLIVVSYDAWDQQTGYGEVEITIPGLTPEEREAQEYLAKINTSENLAYQKTPLVAEGNNENTAGNICDGNKDSRWQANKAVDNTWFAVDLQGYYSVDKVLVSWEASNATSYEIYTAGLDGVYDTTPAATVSGLDSNKAVVKLTKNIVANARYVKIVVTGWSGNAEAYGISPYELAVFGEAVEGYYDVSEYKSTTPYTYPTKTGKIFAGWYTDDTCTTAYTDTEGVAYAKFIDEAVLGTKFQVAEDGSAVRFLSSVDSMDYDQVGFKFTGTYGDAVITEKTKTTEKLYTKITAAGESVRPTVFSNESSYFFTYTVRGMTDAGTNSTWNVTPFYVTLDGTTVEGTPGEFPQN